MSEEIEQVRKEEERRGRRPVDSATLEERRRQKAALREIFNYGTIDDLQDAMREYGISPDSPQWVEVVRIWNDERARG